MPPAGNRNGLCGRRSRPPATEPVRVTGRRGVAAGQYVDYPIGGYSPSLPFTLPAPALPAQFGAAEIAMGTISLVILPVKLGCPNTASSISIIAVSGSLIGSTHSTVHRGVAVYLNPDVDRLTAAAARPTASLPARPSATTRS